MPAFGPTYVRYRVVAVTTLMAVLLYLDRFCIPIAADYIKEDLSLTDWQVGLILGAFFWTYAFGQVPSGWLTDRFGARPMLTCYILFWSLFTGLTGFALAFSAILACRLAMGVGQAGAYPTSANLVSKWIPITGRGSASSIIAFGGRIGGAVAQLLTAFLIVAFVPTSANSLLQTSDMLNTRRLCYEMRHGRDVLPSSDKIAEPNRALLAGKEIISRLSAEVARDVERQASAYAEDLQAAREKAKSEEKSIENVVPDAAPLNEEVISPIVAELNKLLGQSDLFDKGHTDGLSLQEEGSRLLAKGRNNLSSKEVERLNRLVLQAIYPESIKKVYGAGWRYVMFLYGALGLAVAALFWVVSRNRPADHSGCNQEERDLIEGGSSSTVADSKEKIGGVPLLQLITSFSMWLNCLVQWCTNVGWVFIVSWLPRYLSDVHDVPLLQRGWMTSIPLIVGWGGMLAGGKVTDVMVRLVGLRWGRSLPISISRFVAMGAYVVCLFEPSPWIAVACFSVVAFSTDFGTGAMWAFMQDVGGRHVGSVLGWGNMWGNLGAAVAPSVLILIAGEAPNQNWNLAFITCGGAFALAGLAALGMNASKPIVSDDSERKSGK